MKSISRTITVHTYTTGIVDCGTSSIINQEQLETFEPIGDRKLRELKKNGVVAADAIIINHTETEEVFTCSVSAFVEACRNEAAVMSEQSTEDQDN